MGVFGEEKGEACRVKGRELKCLVCGHDRFVEKEAQLNTASATFWGLDWLNKSGVCAVCAECGYIHWFVE